MWGDVTEGRSRVYPHFKTAERKTEIQIIGNERVRIGEKGIREVKKKTFSRRKIRSSGAGWGLHRGSGVLMRDETRKTVFPRASALKRIQPEGTEDRAWRRR